MRHGAALTVLASRSISDRIWDDHGVACASGDLPTDRPYT